MGDTFTYVRRPAEIELVCVCVCVCVCVGVCDITSFPPLLWHGEDDYTEWWCCKLLTLIRIQIYIYQYEDKFFVKFLKCFHKLVSAVSYTEQVQIIIDWSCE